VQIATIAAAADGAGLFVGAVAAAIVVDELFVGAVQRLLAIVSLQLGVQELQYVDVCGQARLPLEHRLTPGCRDNWRLLRTCLVRWWLPSDDLLQVLLLDAAQVHVSLPCTLRRSLAAFQFLEAFLDHFLVPATVHVLQGLSFSPQALAYDEGTARVGRAAGADLEQLLARVKAPLNAVGGLEESVGAGEVRLNVAAG